MIPREPRQDQRVEMASSLGDKEAGARKAELKSILKVGWLLGGETR